MTSLDITFIVIMLIFIALGARLGSLWTGACLIGGFFGAFLVEYYTLPVAAMMGNFSGARLLAGSLLFISGVIIALIPGWVLSRLTHALFLGIFDSVAGLLTGFLSGLIAISLAMLFLLPHVPKVEKSKAWKTSRVAKPYQRFMEDLFNDRRFQKESATEQLKDDFMKDFTPVIEKTQDAISTSSKKLIKKIKK